MHEVRCLAVLGFYIVGVGASTTRYGRGEHRSPAKKHKESFPFSYFSMTKSTKSHIRERSPLLYISSRVHELVAISSAWQVRAAKDRAKIGSFALPATSYYHACEHSARKSRADSCTHCLHALPKQEPMLSFLHKYAKAHSTFALSA